MYVFQHGIIASSNGGGGASYGTLTTNWITATGETDPTILGALNNFETEITAIGLSKFYYLYPFVGGTSSKHSFNFLNTAQYPITWFGGVTHNANGYTPNGTTGYGNTTFNPQTVGVTKEDFGITMYSRTASVLGNRCHVGVTDGASSHIILFDLSGGSWSVASYHNSAFSWVDVLTRKGMFTVIRKGVNLQEFYRNGTYDRNNTASSTGNINFPIFLGARNSGGSASFFSNSNIALQVCHKALSAGDLALLNTANTNFQTALGRFI